MWYNVRMGKVIRTAGTGRRGPLPGKRRKVCAWVRHEIAVGNLKPGERLPDRKWFMARFGIANHPVQLAFEELSRDGLVRSVPGHGTCVADSLPFDGRYLLAVRSNPIDAGSHLFASALRLAAQEVAAQRGVSFEVRDLVDAERDSVAYAEMMDAVRRQRYAGVFVQCLTKEGHESDVLTNIDDVPMAYAGESSHLAQGNLVKSIGMPDFEGIVAEFRRHFAACREKGCRRVAMFGAWNPQYDRESYFRRLARDYDLQIVPGGFHHFDMGRWYAEQFKRLVDLFFRSDGGREADAIVLADDNMLMPFAEVHRKLFGRKDDARHFVSCHCNAPLFPETDYPVSFHGYDLVATLLSLVDYAKDCRAGVRRPRLPAFAPV